MGAAWAALQRRDCSSRPWADNRSSIYAFAELEVLSALAALVGWVLSSCSRQCAVAWAAQLGRAACWGGRLWAAPGCAISMAWWQGARSCHADFLGWAGLQRLWSQSASSLCVLW